MFYVSLWLIIKYAFLFYAFPLILKQYIKTLTICSPLQRPPFPGHPPGPSGPGPAGPAVTPPSSGKKGGENDDDEVWRQKRQERNQEVSTAIERARLRKEEEEKRMDSERKKAAQEKLKALDERSKKKDDKVCIKHVTIIYIEKSYDGKHFSM